MNMKLLFFLFFIPVFTTGQEKFVVSASGLLTESSSDYMVVQFSGKTKAELYKAVLLFANKKYVNPKNVISTVENESITINGLALESIHRTPGHVFDMEYTFNIEVKDEKMKVTAPHFKLSTTSYGKLQTLSLVANNALDGSSLGIYNLKGKLKSELAKKDLEDFFGNYFTQMISSIKDVNNW
jgi:hypothetical protein